MKSLQLLNYRLNRPEYIFRPTQILQRLLHPHQEATKPFEYVHLPWGVKIKIIPTTQEKLGRAIWVMGVYDLSVTEVLWRLIDPGENVIDVGANIGYMTSIMAKKVGKTGSVLAFEPNPEVYQELMENTQTWQQEIGWNQIHPQQIALSNQPGTGLLSLPTTNRGEATLVSGKKSLKHYTVALAKLDEIITHNQSIGIIKIDVEGHELEVLQGANRLIKEQQIRDILFEENSGYPSPVTHFLEAHDYSIFRIWKGFWRPILRSPEWKRSHPWESPNYLATKDSKRAIERLKRLGWNSLKSSGE